MEFEFTYSPAINGFTLFDVDAFAIVDCSPASSDPDDGLCVDVKSIYIEGIGNRDKNGFIPHQDIDVKEFLPELEADMAEHLVENYQNEIEEKWNAHHEPEER